MSTLPSPCPIELLDPQEMAEADRLASASVPTPLLMERAGEAVVRAVLARLDRRSSRRVAVLTGPGNNGGDGYVAARLLAAAGVDTTLFALVDPATLTGDAAGAAASWSGATRRLEDFAPTDIDLVIDALFGAGLSRDLAGSVARVADDIGRWVQAPHHDVVAVDVPSGIDGASGAVRGAAIRASETVTFFRLKPGHVLLPGRLHCGQITLADIGIPPTVLETIRPRARLNLPALWQADLPWPTLAGHKYARGHAVVVSGPPSQTGAARLAARGALRAGAGLVTVATPGDALPIHAAALTAIMTRVVEDSADLRDLLADARKNAVLLGPGLGVGAATRDIVAAALAASAPGAVRTVVLDADALTSFAEDPRTLFAAIRAGGHHVILTPHDGEFSKLFGSIVDSSAAKPKRTREAAAASGATVLLKGADTVVAAPDGRASIAASAAPWLATAGSGDVLAGLVTGLAAQGMPAYLAASAAVWMHAEAACLFGPGLIAEDIPEMLPRVLRGLAQQPDSPA